MLLVEKFRWCKKLVEGSCFMNRAIVTAILRNISDPIGSITNYLDEEFLASAV